MAAREVEWEPVTDEELQAQAADYLARERYGGMLQRWQGDKNDAELDHNSTGNETGETTEPPLKRSRANSPSENIRVSPIQFLTCERSGDTIASTREQTPSQPFAPWFPTTMRQTPTIDVTETTTSNDNTTSHDDSLDVGTAMSPPDRLLNPIAYISNIEQLRHQVLQNSIDKNKDVNGKSGAGNILFEVRKSIANSCQSLKTLQDAGFCRNIFSALVLDRDRPTVVKLMPIEIAKIERLRALCDEMLLRREELGANTFNAMVQLSRFGSACREILIQSQLISKTFEPSAEAVLWATAAHFVDVAVVSYVGAHTGNLDKMHQDPLDYTFHTMSRVGTPLSTMMIPPLAGSRIIVRKRELQCLDQFLRHHSVWVFQDPLSNCTDGRLYLSTDVNTLADIWGPMWKCTTEGNTDYITRYDIGNGFIVPWDQESELDPEPSPNGEGGMEVFCHWIASQDWNDSFVEQHQSKVLSKGFLESDRLLIGANVKDLLVVNHRCIMPTRRKLNIKQNLKNSGNLRHRGTSQPRQERGSQAVQIQASAAGFATLGTTLEYKRIEGFNMKDALLQRWRNGSRNIKYLEMWGGVEASLCTKNARRVQLLHLLRSQGLRKYLKAICFQWIAVDCEKGYFEALKNCRTFRKFWVEHPTWQRNIGDAINVCFMALQETGTDERDDALSALWVEVFDHDDESEENDPSCDFVAAEEHLVILRRSRCSWTGLLRDSSECLTMAVVENICLDYDDSDGSGMRCQGLQFSEDGKSIPRFFPGFAVLQTAIVINEEILEERTRRQLRYRTVSLKRKIAECEEQHDEAARRDADIKAKLDSADSATYLTEYFGHSAHWKGYWETEHLGKGTKFSLGSHGQLKVLSKSTNGYPVLMSWQPVLNTLGKDLKIEFKERALGRSGDLHHSEYMEGAFYRSPLPCLIISNTMP